MAYTDIEGNIISPSNVIPVTVINGGEIATKTKQDLLLAELELKADLTETQPVSLDNNSMIVTLLQKLIDEQKTTNKLLAKIYQ
jgi:hypothetical protein